MLSEQATTIVSVASVLGKVLDFYKLDKYSIARKAGLDVDVSYKPNDRISTQTLQKIWSIAREQSGDECIGLTYAKVIQPASLCGLGLAWITSDTLKDSINRLVRYQYAISTAIDFSLIELDDCYQIKLCSKLKDPLDVSVDAAVATLFQMCRITFGPDLKADRVCIGHEKPSKSEEFNEFFGVKVEFEFAAKASNIFFSKNIFERRLSSSNPDLARMNDQIVVEYLKKFDKKNISLQVRARIIEELNNGVPHQEKIASDLHMSLRNLQRKLKCEGNSYKAILDETRSELSRQYLRGSDRSIVEIGFLLGFTEPSNFARAFRRWVGTSPQEYRQSIT